MRWWSGTTRATGAVANPCQVATTKAAKIPMATPARLRPCRRHVVGTSGHSGLRHSLHSLYVSSNSSVGIMQAVSFWQGTRIEYSRRRCQVPSRHPPPLNEYHHWNQAYENQFRHHDMPTGTTPAGRISTNFASYMPEVIGTPWNPPTPHRRQTQDSPNMEDTCPENRTQNSIFGDPPTHSPKTAVRPPQNRFQTSTIGEPRNRRRKRKSAGRPNPTKPPPSATHRPARRKRMLQTPKQVPRHPPSAAKTKPPETEPQAPGKGLGPAYAWTAYQAMPSRVQPIAARWG